MPVERNGFEGWWECPQLGSLSNPLTAVHLKNLYFLEGGKTAGNSILIEYSGQCLIVDCQMESPSSGVRLHSVNTIEFERSGSPGRFCEPHANAAAVRPRL